MTEPVPYGEYDPNFDTVERDGKVWLGVYEETGVEHYGAREIAFHPFLPISAEQANRLLLAFPAAADPMTTPALVQTATERSRQIRKGYTPEHDDTHPLDEIVGYAQGRLGALPIAGLEETVTLLVEAAAILVAAAEKVQRMHARGYPAS